MTPELEALARRAVACPRWRWMPGMVDTLGNRANDDGWPSYSTIDYGQTDVVEVVAWKVRPPRGAIPDLTDPATLGCLLALVREALGDPEVFARREIGGLGWVVIRSNSVRLIRGETEADALVATLEAAP
jgi:hypothetical protein